MLKDDNIYLHDLIRAMIDIEMCVMNGKYEEAYYHLSKPRMSIDEFLSNMRAKVRTKLLDIHGEKA